MDKKKNKPEYYGYNISFAKKRGIVASVLMGRIVYEMKIALPKKNFVFDMSKAVDVYTEEIRGQLESLENAGLIEFTELENDCYYMTVTPLGVREFICNVL